MLRILVDENIPGVNECLVEFAGLDCEITSIAGRAISSSDCVAIDALLIRSVTNINEHLLSQAEHLRFIASATIGMNHVDQSACQQKNIQLVNAPGCNAQGVCEYVMSAISVCRPEIFLGSDLSVGLVGCGNTGSRVFKQLRKHNIRTLVYDPILEKTQCNDIPFVSFEHLLSTCDVISFHVPLTRSNQSECPTVGMFDAAMIDLLKTNVTIINTSRGEVIDEPALKKFALAHPDVQCAFDVWQNEPNIDWEMVQRCRIATPHIAGYSWRGKWRGTLTICQALLDYFEHDVALDESVFPNISQSVKIQNTRLFSDWYLSSYPIFNDHQQFLQSMKETDSIPNQFDALRKNYQARCEWQDSFVDGQRMDHLLQQKLLAS